MMATSTASTPTAEPPIRGKIVEAEVKASVDPGRPLPLVCALYGIETEEGMWLCAYYGANRSNFDYLPRQGALMDETKLGIVFHTKKFVPKDHYQPALWEEFKKTHFLAYGGHEE